MFQSWFGGKNGGSLGPTIIGRTAIERQYLRLEPRRLRGLFSNIEPEGPPDLFAQTNQRLGLPSRYCEKCFAANIKYNCGFHHSFAW
jgi:hypothetical protein